MVRPEIRFCLHVLIAAEEVTSGVLARAILTMPGVREAANRMRCIRI